MNTLIFGNNASGWIEFDRTLKILMTKGLDTIRVYLHVIKHQFYYIL